MLPFLFLISCLVVACASSPPPTTPTTVPTPALDPSGKPILKDVGGTTKVSVSDLAAWKAVITKTARAKTISEPGLVPIEAKGVWLILHLTASNGSGEAGAFPSHGLVVKDAAGKEYKIDATASDHYSIGAKLPNQSATIAPKGGLEVGAIFDIDPAATGLKLKVGTQELAIQE